jgi:16S rRNA (cytidine1402-2'-O)-methyltransferase
MLTIIPTPIGNLADITLRAVESLKAADFLIAENPGHTAKLLQHYQIPKKLVIQFAEHNEQRVLPKILSELKTKQGALVTDAGTPGISDPGFRLVRACWEEGIGIDSLPGPSAAITALAASGLPTDKFLFVGFLPKTENKVLSLCQQALTLEATLIAYESPERIKKTLGYLATTFPNAKVFVGRELTKLHQTYYRDTALNLSKQFSKPVKGEITICISFK